MRLISIVLLLANFASAQAAVVTFDNMTTTEWCDQPGETCSSITTPEGFVFYVEYPPYEGVQIYNTTGPGGYASTVGMVGAKTLFIAHQSGNAFDLQSIDINFWYFGSNEIGTGAASPRTITGFDENGDVIDSLSYGGFDNLNPYGENELTAILNDSWSSVYSLSISAQTFNDNFGTTRYFQPVVYGLSATVVPVPAAVWLLGSALIGLGLLRRKPI